MPTVSIVIRARNEERWIGRCLHMVFQQDFRDFEVILVDNDSTDHTLAIARKFPVKVVTIDRFRPGEALNLGIRSSQGRFIGCLSAHCIPKDAKWLSHLVKALEDPAVAGVYGRQLPMPYSSDLDKRDLLIVFGLDRRIQIKDSFFHNANSLIKRNVWEAVPFDATTPNVEDRIWGESVICKGYRLAYEPDAAVYHYHGIHQDRDERRATSVVRVLETLESLQEHRSAPEGFEPGTMRVIAILPVLGAVETVAGHNLLDRALAGARSSRFIDSIAVIAEDVEARAFAARHGATPVERPSALAGPRVGTEEVLRYALSQCEAGEKFFDTVVYVNYLYPFRPRGFLDTMISEFARTGVDTLVPTLADFQPQWTQADGKLVRCDLGLEPRAFKTPVHRGIIGAGCVTSSELVRRGVLLGDNVGLVPLEASLYGIQAKDAYTRAVVAAALQAGEAAFGTARGNP